MNDFIDVFKNIAIIFISFFVFIKLRYNPILCNKLLFLLEEIIDEYEIISKIGKFSTYSNFFFK